MNLILSQYVRLLKERGQFDVLMPDLLVAMRIIPITKPGAGTRQFGVDLPAVGIDPDDGKKKLFLFVLKCGDIGRREWENGEQAVRPSLNEILDIYLRNHIAPEHANLPCKIVLSTSGDLKEAAKHNWEGFSHSNNARAEFSFWGADKVATLMEKYMLNEHIFSDSDRTNLRRSLALAGEIDYSLHDVYKLLASQLKLNEAVPSKMTKKEWGEFSRALILTNLSANIFAKWAADEGNSKHSYVALERALIWSWHQVVRFGGQKNKVALKSFWALWESYCQTSHTFFAKIHQHFYVKDGLSGYARENACFSLVVFEHIGMTATIGLSQLYGIQTTESEELNAQNAEVCADALCHLIVNNSVAASPRFDGNAIDITLALYLLCMTGHVIEAKQWLANIVVRLDCVFRDKKNFPICTDSADDLLEVEFSKDSELISRLMSMSWLLPTLASWCVILDYPEAYAVLATGHKESYSEICAQLWHPVADVFELIYLKSAHYESGESEAPIIFPADMSKYKDQMLKLLESDRHNILRKSPSLQIGIPALDLIACRHFRTPVPPVFWYHLLKIDISQLSPLTLKD